MPYSYHMTHKNWRRAAFRSRRDLRILCPLCPHPKSWSMSLYRHDGDALWTHWYNHHNISKLEAMPEALYDEQSCRQTFVCPVCRVNMQHEAFEKVGLDADVQKELARKRPVYYMMLHFLCMHRDQQKEHIAVMLLNGVTLKGV